jgi:hypothetical protein
MAAAGQQKKLTGRWLAEVVSGVPEGDDLVSVNVRSLAGAAILRLLSRAMVDKRGPKSSFPDDPRPKSYPNTARTR